MVPSLEMGEYYQEVTNIEDLHNNRNANKYNTGPADGFGAEGRV